MKIPPWTYGFLNADENCPRKSWHMYVARDLPKEQKSEAQEFGIKVHSHFELRLQEDRPLPADMQRWESLVAPVKEAAKTPGAILLTEQNLAMTADGRPSEFFADDVYGRGRVDTALVFGVSAVIFDWKTGKVREDPLELETQALLLKARYPALESVKGYYVWLQENRLGKTHDVSNFAATYNSIRRQMRDIESRDPETEWPAKPNPLCGGSWGSCPVTTCPHRKGPK